MQPRQANQRPTWGSQGSSVDMAVIQGPRHKSTWLRFVFAAVRYLTFRASALEIVTLQDN